MLNWANQFNICCLLDNHHYNFSHHRYECIVAAGDLRSVEAHSGEAFKKLQSFIDCESDWIFGHLSYDLKNEIESLHSNGYDGIQFPDLFFFVPKIILQLDEHTLTVGSLNDDHILIHQQVMNCDGKPFSSPKKVAVKSKISRKKYIDTINQLKRHILRGDCYEINFCQEFYAEDTSIDPISTYLSLSDASPNPYSAFYKLNDKFLLCASPERYLEKTGFTIISQPIKGTWQRSINNNEEDELNKNLLSTSAKDKSENVMVVDLVRNDLSKVCEEGSVKVDELFGVYKFPQLYQMISTISGRLNPGMSITEIMKATFPMGSMTGAPKKKVMELIEQYEVTRRGIFSGAVGYISPEKDFDFNVVIRSIMYNASNRYLSYQAGSAITFYSDAEKEYNECLLKAMAIKKVLAGDQYF
ncbi:MAG: anthranilate synthase component I family protein [Chitinophagaceae bacterium]|nr:anthranilate synthase component I family protein [Chitinophagaceae bacterium]